MKKVRLQRKKIRSHRKKGLFTYKKQTHDK